MTRVVRNESLAVRQQLSNFYIDQLGELVDKSGRRWGRTRMGLEGNAEQPYDLLLSQAVENGISGLIIFDDEGKRTYPLLSDAIQRDGQPSQENQKVWKFEFVDGNYEEAAKLYRKQADSDNVIVRLGSYLNLSRCMAKLNRLDEAVEECKKAAFSDLQDNADADILNVIGNARVQLLSLTTGKDRYKSLYEDTFGKLVSMIFSVNKAGTMLATDSNMFLTERVLQILQEDPHLNDKDQEAIERINKYKAIEEYSVGFVESNPDIDLFYGEDHRRRVGKHQADGESVYSLRQKGDKAGFLFLFTGEDLSRALFDFEERFGDDVAFWIGDEDGVYVWGEENPAGEQFLTVSLKNALGRGWRATLYFIGENLFDKAANRQRTIYTWTGILVIGLMAVCTCFAGGAVGRQAKLNRLKNDFVATITHELKTPLASMRVLVDTLLDGSYNNQQQATEYLQLISKENRRLTGLIDNFLTFSRMERNKQAFGLDPASPADIATSAADAVRTKFNNEKCEFTVSIDDNLPSIMADKDAMITVLVNLLDNAYNYSHDDKRIELKVFAENNAVYFSVADNGIGMTSRQVKKIFDRFYQADTSLTRRTQGAGLGLSIVKFILDAHNAKMTVDSIPDKGSTFTVTLPVAD